MTLAQRHRDRESKLEPRRTIVSPRGRTQGPRQLHPDDLASPSSSGNFFLIFLHVGGPLAVFGFPTAESLGRMVCIQMRGRISRGIEVCNGSARRQRPRGVKIRWGRRERQFRPRRARQVKPRAEGWPSSRRLCAVRATGSAERG